MVEGQAIQILCLVQNRRKTSFFRANTIGDVHSDRTWSKASMQSIMLISAFLKSHAFGPVPYGADVIGFTSSVVS